MVATAGGAVSRAARCQSLRSSTDSNGPLVVQQQQQMESPGGVEGVSWDQGSLLNLASSLLPLAEGELLVVAVAEVWRTLGAWVVRLWGVVLDEVCWLAQAMDGSG